MLVLYPQFDLYNNPFIFTLGGDCTPNPYPPRLNSFFVRGGSGVITDTTFPKISSCLFGTKSALRRTVFNIQHDSEFAACQDTYPAARRIGQGPDGTTDPLYIWNNTGSAGNNVPAITASECFFYFAVEVSGRTKVMGNRDRDV